MGGIVFHLYQGSDGLAHGLIVSKTQTTSATNAYRINLLTSAFASTAKGTSSFVRGVKAF